MPAVIRLLRPVQYVKNLLVFAAPGAAGRLNEGSVVLSSVLAFVLFSAVSSAGYVGNDILDAEADRLHPDKKDRPIASGAVSPQLAQRILIALIVPAIALSPLLGWPFMIALIGYAAITASYSSYFKRIPWIELIVVSLGFAVRAVAGGPATSTPLSAWFLVVVSAGSLLVITGKRVGEFIALGADTPSRKVLASYRLQQLQAVLALSAAAAVGAYGAWAAAEARNQVTESSNSLVLRLTVLPFALAIGRYLILSWRGQGETPESVLLADRIMIAAGLGWTVLYAWGRYL